MSRCEVLARVLTIAGLPPTLLSEETYYNILDEYSLVSL